MLECVLYSEPDLYDLLFPGARDSGPACDESRQKQALAAERFYVDQAGQAGGRVLELGCGSGRLTVQIAQNGVEIVGLDLSASMLSVAQSKAAAARVRVQFAEADMRSFDLPGKFSAVLIPGNSLLHLLTNEDLKRCFTSVRSHLNPNGRLVFDISKWDIQRLARDPGQRHPVFRVNDPKRGEISIEETANYDAATQVRHIRWYLSAPNAPDFRVVDYDLRVIYPQELLLLLETTGFELEARYGEFNREVFESSSPRQVCVCRLRN